MENELKIRVMAKKMLKLQRFESSKYQKKQPKSSLAIIWKFCFIVSNYVSIDDKDINFQLISFTGI